MLLSNSIWPGSTFWIKRWFLTDDIYFLPRMSSAFCWPSGKLLPIDVFHLVVVEYLSLNFWFKLEANDELLYDVFTSVGDEILSSNPNLGWLKYLLLGRQAGRLAGNGSGELGSNDELLGGVFTSVDDEILGSNPIWAGLNTWFWAGRQQETEVMSWDPTMNFLEIQFGLA